MSFACWIERDEVAQFVLLAAVEGLVCSALRRGVKVGKGLVEEELYRIGPSACDFIRLVIPIAFEGQGVSFGW